MHLYRLLSLFFFFLLEGASPKAPFAMAQDEEHKPKVNEKVHFFKLFTFADRLDVTLMTIGFICAIANGFSQPLMTVIFGKLINAFGTTDQFHIVKEVSKVY